MNIREDNGKEIQKILDIIGPENGTIRTDSEWAFSVYYSERSKDTLTIEMCLRTDYNGDPLFDPLMRIELTLGVDGKVTEATPVYYLSQTLFYTEEIYSKENPSCYDPKLCEKADELDARLSEWIKMLKIQGYFSGRTVSLT